MRDTVKNALFELGALHCRLGMRRYLKPRITVLLYHRVTDDVRDNLTVGIEQSEAIRRWKPWESSTGPRTPEGKAKVAQNSYKGGHRPLRRRIAKVLRRNEQAPNELSIEEYDSMAETVVAAALSGNLWALQEIAKAIDVQ